MANEVMDMQFDEVSLVDRPANQFAAVVLAKRANQEAAVPNDFFDTAGKPVTLEFDDDGAVISGQYENGNSVNEGDILYDSTGEPVQLGGEAEEETDDLQAVGKSAFLDRTATSPVAKGLIEGLRDELSKAVTDSDREAVFAKAFDGMAQQLEAQQTLIEKAARAAESERNLRLTREYIAKADTYKTAVAGDRLGPVLLRAAAALSYEDQVVLDEALTSAGALNEIGKSDAGQSSASLGDEVERFLVDDDTFTDFSKALSTAGEQVSKAQALTRYFDENPRAYSAYKRDRNG